MVRPRGAHFGERREVGTFPKATVCRQRGAHRKESLSIAPPLQMVRASSSGNAPEAREVSRAAQIRTEASAALLSELSHGGHATSDRVIYFPYTNVPATQWIAQVALYWDELGCLIPSNYFEDEFPQQSQMLRAADPWVGARGSHRRLLTQEMLAAGLIRPIDPEPLLGAIPGFAEDFYTILDAQPPFSTDRVDAFGDVPVLVHSVKLGSLFDELHRRGLAQARPKFAPWIPVERATAALYVAYLASRIGELPNYEMTPITDEVDRLGPFIADVAPPAQGGEARLRDRDLSTWKILLNKVLPGPQVIDTADDLDLGFIRQVAHFKEQHGDELLNFRRALEQRVQRLSAFVDADERAAGAQGEADDLQKQIDEIASRMQDVGWREIGWSSMAVAAATATLVSAVDPLSPAAVIGGATALALGARQLHIDMHKDQPSGPLAYAVLAQQHFSPAG